MTTTLDIIPGKAKWNSSEGPKKLFFGPDAQHLDGMTIANIYYRREHGGIRRPD
jgi:hypothetical protein